MNIKRYPHKWTNLMGVSLIMGDIFRNVSWPTTEWVCMKNGWIKLWQLYGLCGDRIQWKQRGAAYFLTKPTSCSMEINGENHHMSMRKIVSPSLYENFWSLHWHRRTRKYIHMHTTVSWGNRKRLHLVFHHRTSGNEKKHIWGKIRQLRKALHQEPVFFLRNVTVDSAKIVKRAFDKFTQTWWPMFFVCFETSLQIGRTIYHKTHDHCLHFAKTCDSVSLCFDPWSVSWRSRISGLDRGSTSTKLLIWCLSSL